MDMESYTLALVSALWLGILTSISPCPLATNITAISYVSRRVGSPRASLTCGLLYTAGRSLAYLVVAVIVIGGLSSIPSAANFLQQYINAIIGPVLIVSGILLTGIVSVPLLKSGFYDGFQKKVDKWGVLGAFPLGIAFALAFCPVSAALFFGSLIPLSLQHHSTLAIPLLYGFGTSLPVAAFALILAFAANHLGKTFKILTYIEKWMRYLTALIFLAVGIYYTFNFTF